MDILSDFLTKNAVAFREAGTHHHVRHGWIGLQCPYCRTSDWHLGVRLADGYCSCWRCGKHKLGEAIMQASGLPWGSVAKAVQSTQKGRLAPQQRRPDSQPVILPPAIGPLLTPHLDYIRSRGLNPGYLRDTWGVQGIGRTTRLAWRLFIPIKLHNRIVSWTTRAVGDQKKRYLSASVDEEAVPHKEVLYGADLASHTVIVCEGPGDAWAIGPGAVCTFGLKISHVQMVAIAQYPHRYICFDRSPHAQKQAEKLATKLDSVMGETDIIEIESGTDPGNADPEEIAEIRQTFLS